MAPPKWAMVGIGISICAAMGEYKAHRVAQAARRLLRIANHLTVWRSAFVYLAFKIDTRPTGQTLPAIAYTLAQIIAKARRPERLPQPSQRQTRAEIQALTGDAPNPPPAFD